MGKTTREQLDSYKSKKAEIQELQYKLHNGDFTVGNSTINDYRTGYPIPQSIVGVDWNRMTRYRRRIETLEAECEEVERWIENITDSLTRRIFRMYFIDGLAQKQIGSVIHLDKSRISRKIDDFIKNASKATNATL